MDLSSDWNLYLQLWGFSFFKQKNLQNNLQMISKVFKSFTNKEILFLLAKFLLQSAFFPKMINAKRV